MTCAQCGEAMWYGTKVEAVESTEGTLEVPVEAWWCDTCDDGVIDGDALMRGGDNGHLS